MRQIGIAADDAARDERRTSANTAQLPGGGTTLFPHYRVVALYGAAGVPGLGVLGQGAPNAAAAHLRMRPTRTRE